MNLQLGFYVIPKYKKYTKYDFAMISREIRNDETLGQIYKSFSCEGGFSFKELEIRTQGATNFSDFKHLGRNLMESYYRYKETYPVLWILGKGKQGGNIYQNYPVEKLFKVRDIFEKLGHLVVYNVDFIKKDGKYKTKSGIHNKMSKKKIEEHFLRWGYEEKKEIFHKILPYEIIEEIFKYVIITKKKSSRVIR